MSSGTRFNNSPRRNTRTADPRVVAASKFGVSLVAFLLKLIPLCGNLLDIHLGRVVGLVKHYTHPLVLCRRIDFLSFFFQSAASSSTPAPPTLHSPVRDGGFLSGGGRSLAHGQ